MAQAFSTEKVGWAKGINGQATLWSWGANSYGQLAQGNCDDKLVPTPVSNVNGEEIQTITGGGGHTVVITKDGSLKVCGSNNKGQLGLGHLTDVSVLTPLPAFTQSKVVEVAAGWDFTITLNNQGELFSFGSNAFGQLGNSSLPSKSSTPSRIVIPNHEPVWHIAAGLRHAVALSENGSVYCWGHAKKGQCGCICGENPGLKITSPTKAILPIMEGKIIDIVAGSYHTAALSDAGEVLVWGCNKYGQATQTSEGTLQVNTPLLVPKDRFNGRKVKVIRSGWTHLIVQTDTGHLYSWGRGDYGQLGRDLSSGKTFSHTPGLIDSQDNFVDVQCGSEHALFLSDKQKCYAVGWNEHGLCGTGDEENIQTLRLVEGLRHYSVIKLGCGGGHCFAITSNDKESIG